MENSKIIILAIIGIIIIIIGIGLSLVEESVIENEERVDEVWHSSGPISIDKAVYNIGEKIFINVESIKPTDKGEAVFLRPIGDDNYKKYLGIKFDGEKSANFNYYFEPKTHPYKKICSTDELVGTWKIKLDGTEYEDLTFEILNQVSDWDTRSYEPVC